MPPCRTHTYDAIAVGDEATLERCVTAHDVDRFAELSGDTNPLHTDEAYARAEGFRQRVAHGALLVGFFSSLIGMELPGERCILHQVQLQFPAPVCVGDRLNLRVAVAQKVDAAQILVLQASATCGETVVARGTIQVGVRAMVAG